VQVTINGITIPGVSCNFGTVNQPLNPGETASFTATACQALNPGTKITIVVQGKSMTGEQVRAVGQVVVM